MACDLYNLSYSTWEEIGQPTAIAISYISGWYMNNVGKLNNALITAYSGVGVSSCGRATGIDPCLGDNEGDIFKELYKVQYYDRQVNSFLGAAALSPWTEIKDDVSSIRRISQNDIAKTYINLRKEAQANLNDMIFAYQRNNARTIVMDMGSPTESIPWGNSIAINQDRSYHL